MRERWPEDHPRHVRCYGGSWRLQCRWNALVSALQSCRCGYRKMGLAAALPQHQMQKPLAFLGLNATYPLSNLIIRPPPPRYS